MVKFLNSKENPSLRPIFLFLLQLPLHDSLAKRSHPIRQISQSK